MATLMSASCCYFHPLTLLFHRKPLFFHENLLGIEQYVEKNGDAMIDRIKKNLKEDYNMKLVFSEVALSIIIDFIFGGSFPVKELSVIYNQVRRMLN